MTEPTIICPQCRAEIKLTESLAAPLIESTRKDYEQRLAKKDADVAKRETALLEREATLNKEKETIEAQVVEKVKREREMMAADVAKREAGFQERETALLKEKETLENQIAERVKREREIIAADVVKREAALQEREAILIKEKEAIDDKIAERLKQERATIVAEEARKAKLALAADLEHKSKEVAELNQVLEDRNKKLKEAQDAQADLLRQKRQLDDAQRELELTIEKRVQESIDATRAQALKEAEEALGLKVKEKEQTIASMQRQIEELKRKAEQGSQQLQGEVQELELEALLAAKFPLDIIAPVPKGEFGGDVLQSVRGPLGQECGVILWESKRTKNWSEGWLSKLRDDQRAARADIAVMVSQALPRDLDTFDLVDGVWVTHPRSLLPVALSLRYTLIEVSLARLANEGQQTKMELVYQYLTGPGFRQRVEAIVEAFSTMQEDLSREKKAIMKEWAKREMQIDRVIQATVGMYGDLQGIAGKTLQEIEGLMLPAIEDQTE